MPASERVRELVERIQSLEADLEEELRETEQHALYQISNRKVQFEERVREAHRRLRVGLAYPNGLERMNCALCGYVNGVIAYTREIAARTEQYWCPIEHARKLVGTHARYRHFLAYGDATDYPGALERMRRELAEEGAGGPRRT